MITLENRICLNQDCLKEFSCEKWKKNKFCSRLCGLSDKGTKLKMSISGKNRPPISEETRAKKKLFRHTKESKEKISKASIKMNANFTEEQKKEIVRKRNESKKGFKHNDETKKKLSLFRKDKTYDELYSPEESLRIRTIIKEKSSKPKSKEHLKNWSESRKINGWFKDPIATGLKISKSNKGKPSPFINKTAEEVKLIVEKTKETKRNNPDLIRGGKSKYYDTVIGKVQGKLELLYIESLIRDNKFLPIKPKGIKTPTGDYFPDFEFDDYFIEIKSQFTYEVFKGLRAGRSNSESKQENKIIWVSSNIKPVKLLILDRKGILIDEIIY